ncbi:flagellar biosynthesis anti-sigma factor FlgM [Ruminococcus sp. HUN007]|uniref:flagellar biosynthesis anti-sigma factor FlgM n=1 Tax=Ruminococcus sp. HUN007 TaxID=1514668 RepID=UPI0005D2B9D8|nr:flagellar biosynthesis anti-sigma factor FlgM [Ruminococcus sp. HUN007]
MNFNVGNISGGFMKTEKVGSAAGIKAYTNIMTSSGRPAAPQRDKVSISPEASSYCELDKTTKSISSEVSGPASQEKISSLKAQIQSGTYSVSAGSVADAILDRMAF